MRASVGVISGRSATSRRFVLEIVELADNLGSALGGEQFERLEGRAVVLAKTIAARGLPPLGENKLAGVRAPGVGVRQRFGIEIAEAG
jgi:hypothetical protein